MSLVTVIWSMISAACLTLAAVHGFVWWRRRADRANLLFSLMAVATALYAMCELRAITSVTPVEFGRWLWWAHLPFWVIMLTLVGFVRVYMRAGRLWLAWSVVVLRTVPVVLNFIFSPAVNYREITAIRHTPFLGDTVSMPEGVPNPWMLLGQLGSILLILFVADASVTVWSRGERRLAVALGAVIIVFVAAATAEPLLFFWGVIQAPFTISLFYTGIIVAMGYELSRNVIRAGQLALDLQASEAGLTESREDLRIALTEVTRLKDQLQQENIYLKSEIELENNFNEVIGQSDEIKYTLFKVEQVAPTDATVLILGETGTVKELIARAIHKASPRAARPLVKINCATLPANLIESELFGHERGAFTGANALKVGRFEVANGATLFLDEIGELPLELQSKLLRVLQEGEFERLGSNKTVKVDVRIIAATNRNLNIEVQKGLFREDLWYRLSVFPITVPPLRQRKGDLPMLVNFFVDKFGRKMGRGITNLPAGVMTALQEYTWPGNVRELANVIERAIISGRGPTLQLADKLVATSPALHAAGADVRNLLDVERQHILQVLESTNWKIEGATGAARELGLNPSTLRSRMAKLDIQRPI